MAYRHPMEPMMKILKRIFFVLILIMVIGVAYFAGRIGQASRTDYRPRAIEPLDIHGQGSSAILTKDTFQILTWNIGFAGLGEESDFFYNGGKMVRQSQAIGQKNMNGILDVLRQYATDLDMIFLQEVDSAAKRSYYEDQIQVFQNSFPHFHASFAKNYDVNHVPLPLFKPMGPVVSGMLSLSRAKPLEAQRFSYEENETWPINLFMLDHCFLLSRLPLPGGKDLIWINTHSSPHFDRKVRARHLEQLATVIEAEYKKGNYVIVGGDWNMYPSGYEGLPGYPIPRAYSQKFIPSDFPHSDWNWVVDMDSPTNRYLNAPLSEASERVILDYFLTSPNIEPIKIETKAMNFSFSDHEPVVFQFRIIQ